MNNFSTKSFWQTILDRLSQLRDAFRFTPNTDFKITDTVTFSISFIALAAKLAKADGRVTRDEVYAFREIFIIPPEEEKNAARVYNLCRQEVTGYETYAQQMSAALGSSHEAQEIKKDVLHGLFYIAMADGVYDPGEDAFLQKVATIFDIGQPAFETLKAQHVPEYFDPFDVLGIDEKASLEDARTARKALIRENHPDVLKGRGLPDAMVQLGQSRIRDINDAYHRVEEMLEKNPAHSL